VDNLRKRGGLPLPPQGGAREEKKPAPSARTPRLGERQDCCRGWPLPSLCDSLNLPMRTMHGKNHSGKHDKVCALGPILTRTARDGARHHLPNDVHTSPIRLVLVNQPACSTLPSGESEICPQKTSSKGAEPVLRFEASRLMTPHSCGYLAQDR